MDRRRWHYRTRQPGFIIRSVLLVLLAGFALAWTLGRKNPPSQPQPSHHVGRSDPTDPQSQLEELLQAAAAAPDPQEVTQAILKDLAEHPVSETQLTEWIRGLQSHFSMGDPKQLFPHETDEESAESMELLEELEDISAKERHEFYLELITLAKLSEDRAQLFRHAAAVLWLNNPASQNALTALEQSAKQQPPVPRVQELLAECALAERNFLKTLDYYIKAGQEPEAASCKKRALTLCLDQRLRDRLQQLRALPEYQEPWQELSAYHQREGALLLGNYGDLLTLTVNYVFSHAQSSVVESILTLLCGVVWFLLLHQLGGVPVRGHGLSVAALVLGFLSPIVTLYILSLQERLVGLDRNGEFVNDLIFYVSGVGLREELSKLLLFAPLLWWLRQKSDAEILVTAGCVGLGFAMEENIQYFGGLAKASALSRFITANFMHIALTGLSGLALARWVRFPRNFWEQSLITIIGMILLHGGYDFCIGRSDPRGVLSLNAFPTIILMALAYGYCQELRRVRLAKGNVFGPQWVFLLGVAILTSASFVAASHLVGLALASQLLYLTGLESALLIFLFAYQLRDL
jgi:RsiW-degrading membrane proteinase PrsW (M82 family)